MKISKDLERSEKIKKQTPKNIHHIALGIVAEILFALAKRLGAESPTQKGMPKNK